MCLPPLPVQVEDVDVIASDKGLIYSLINRIKVWGQGKRGGRSGGTWRRKPLSGSGADILRRLVSQRPLPQDISNWSQSQVSGADAM